MEALIGIFLLVILAFQNGEEKVPEPVVVIEEKVSSVVNVNFEDRESLWGKLSERDPDLELFFDFQQVLLNRKQKDFLFENVALFDGSIAVVIVTSGGYSKVLDKRMDAVINYLTGMGVRVLPMPFNRLPNRTAKFYIFNEELADSLEHEIIEPEAIHPEKYGNL